MSSANGELKLGRYRILREIGRGAGGSVCEALDVRLDRVVAVKLLPRENLDDPDAGERIERFLREARAAARLNHPGIVAIYDSDIEPETGRPYIVMEFVNGRSLHEILALQPRLELSKIVSIGSQVARALQAAHDRGIIHRDVKPGNLLITADGRVKLTDFGVARLGASDLTSRGQFVGTPNYASPEQVEGHPVDGRTDLFCLGVVLFRCATGALPFAGDTLSAVSLRIARGEFEDSERFAPELPAAFHELLRRALAHDPGDRFSSGEEMARALEQAGAAAGHETLRVPLPAAVEATPSTSGKPGLTGPAQSILAVLLLLLVGTAVWILTHGGRTETAPPAETEVRAPAPSSEASVPGLRIIERGDSSLVIEHRSHLADETLIAAVDGAEVLRKRVRVTGGLFQRIGGRRFEWSVPVASGKHTVRIRIVGKSMKTEAVTEIVGTFAPGAPARLGVTENPYRDSLTLSWE